jgi:hypothetical protein
MGQHQKNEKMNKEIILSYSYVHISVVNCAPPPPRLMVTVSVVNYFVCPWEEICVQCK